MNGFLLAFSIMFMPFYFSLLVAVLIHLVFACKENRTIKPFLMIGGALATLYPAILFFSHMLQRLEAVLLQ